MLYLGMYKWPKYWFNYQNNHYSQILESDSKYQLSIEKEVSTKAQEIKEDEKRDKDWWDTERAEIHKGTFELGIGPGTCIGQDYFHKSDRKEGRKGREFCDFPWTE